VTWTTIQPEIARIYALVGPVGVLLVVLSIYSLTLIFLKAVIFARARLGRMGFVGKSFEQLEDGGVAAMSDALDGNRHPIAQILHLGARLAENGTAAGQIEARVEAEALSMFARFSRYDRVLELIGLIAPLLGLLGTILGMIEAFQALQSSGAQADPTALAGGIWEALLTTALGLAVAIPAIVASTLAENRVETLKQQTAAALAPLLARLEAKG
jgi:biopolymer transport protein ExbB